MSVTTVVLAASDAAGAVQLSVQPDGDVTAAPVTPGLVTPRPAATATQNSNGGEPAAKLATNGASSAPEAPAPQVAGGSHDTGNGNGAAAARPVRRLPPPLATDQWVLHVSRCCCLTLLSAVCATVCCLVLSGRVLLLSGCTHLNEGGARIGRLSCLVPVLDRLQRTLNLSDLVAHARLVPVVGNGGQAGHVSLLQGPLQLLGQLGVQAATLIMRDDLALLSCHDTLSALLLAGRAGGMLTCLAVTADRQARQSEYYT
ncbi:hypothetical protein HaLaN_18536 [Haematococcus lacustris]|uniref:Uncharacterized protein n=1 Tax=Haematococcus lacustris TaxID=44745 RepID=A0A699ZNS4_HAELA|nr:hypothetical protein HaLaN_18536 [Haematococcus lacustris]